MRTAAFSLSFSLSIAILPLLALSLGCFSDDPAEPGPENPDVNNGPDEPEPAKPMSIETTEFGALPDGTPATLYKLKHPNGREVHLTDYGARIVAVLTRDKQGELANITLGYDSVEDYLANDPFFGPTVGRFANRIAGGKFSIAGEEYVLDTNDGPNHLHGGKETFAKKLWQAEPLAATEQGAGVKFTYVSPDGEGGYPGELTTSVQYTLTAEGDLRIDYLAETTAATVVNLTNHAYWNLNGADSGTTVLDHELMVNATKYLPVDETLIPTGEFADVAETPLDFREMREIGAKIEQLKGESGPGGYDHCYAVDGPPGEFRLAARLKDPSTGRVMEVHTTEPGIQVYTGNFLDGTDASGGYEQHAAICLETQHYPNSPNESKFPSTMLLEGDAFRSTTLHKFSVEE